jgi:hypothetical protein
MKISFLPLVLIILVGYGLDARAQNSGTTTNSMFGSRTLGGSSISSGGSSLFSNPMSGGLSGMSGMSGLSGMSGMNQSNSSGNMQSSTGFVGANTNQTDFVGAAQAAQNQGMNSSSQRYGQGSGQNYGQNYGNTNSYNRTNRANQPNYGQSGYAGQNTNRQTKIVTVRRVDFQYPTPTGADVSSTLALLLQKTPGIHSLSPMEVSYQSGILVLKGIVATAHDRDLAERLARLEPGVDRIQNDLVVATPAPPAAK